MKRFLMTAFFTLAVTSSGSAQSPAAVLAPTGTLRVVFLGGNPVHGRVNPATGATTGTVPDIAREVARRLGVPAAIVSKPNAAGVSAALKDGTADIGFLAFDEERANDVDFGTPFVIMLNSYLVKADSPIRTSVDIDRPEVIVAAVTGTSQQFFVSRALRRAKIRMFDVMPPQAEVERLLDSGEVTAFAINRQRSLDAQKASPRLRALDDSFMKVEQSVVVPKGRRDRLDAINPMVSELVKSGFVQGAVERAGISGVELPR
jgi:polar amino acid transport system substrate-binding protein